MEAIDIQSGGRVNSNSHAIDSEDRREGKGRAKKRYENLSSRRKESKRRPPGSTRPVLLLLVFRVIIVVGMHVQSWRQQG